MIKKPEMKTDVDYLECPLMLVTEDDKVNLEACDYEPESSSCCMGCKRKNKIQREVHWAELALERRLDK